MSFKLIAIRPLNDCNPKFLKNLNKNQLYNFYNDYQFLDNSGNEITKFDSFVEVNKIEYNPTIPENLYNVCRVETNPLTSKSKDKSISINISAIVGKNGSGKSALSELFLFSLFVISNKFGFIDKNKFIYKNNNSENIIDEKFIEESKRYDLDLPIIEKEICVEIYYRIDAFLYKLILNSNNISYEKSKLNKKKFIFTNKQIEVIKKEQLPSIFYSMIINYSFYGFNTNEIGMWIKAFFHKNDGYQMPIVINPYRDEGNMNINIESYLTRSRVLANILSIKDYIDINPKSPITEIDLQLDATKDYQYLGSIIPRFNEDFILLFRNSILIPLFETMFNFTYYPELNNGIDNEIKIKAEIYLIQKLLTIPTKYPSFSDFKFKKDDEGKFIFDEIKISKYIKEICADKSHITLKVRQTLNFLRENIFDITNLKPYSKLNLKDIVTTIENIREKDWFTEVVDYLPPPIFFSKIMFEDGSNYNSLSSGEKQKISSLNSIIYHLKNIDSVHKSKEINKKNGVITYENINLIFDEIELYHHPNFQKNIISELLNFINKAKYEYIKNINIIFLTHSPFILSDIPNSNIMYLENGRCLYDTERPQKSFGANITDLLADSFFFGNGDKSLIGDFVKNKIHKVIKWLNIIDRDIEKDKLEKENYKKIIEIIDEPILRRKLAEMYSNVINENLELDLIDKEIQILEKRKKEIQFKTK